jgi:hypothetical protein
MNFKLSAVLLLMCKLVLAEEQYRISYCNFTNNIANYTNYQLAAVESIEDGFKDWLGSGTIERGKCKHFTQLSKTILAKHGELLFSLATPKNAVFTFRLINRNASGSPYLQLVNSDPNKQKPPTLCYYRDPNFSLKDDGISINLITTKDNIDTFLVPDTKLFGCSAN